MSESDESSFNMDDTSQSLICAVCNEDYKLVTLLLEDGANVNVKDEENKPILHLAVENGNEKIVRLLLEGGADVNAKDGDFNSILHFAAGKGDEKMVKVLLEGGAYVDDVSLDYKTALHYAVENGHEQIVKMLLESGANVDAEDSNDQTPLHMATDNLNVNIVKILLEGGADVNLRSGLAKTVLEHAVKSGNEEIVQIILEAGADINAHDLSRDSYFETVIYFAVTGGNREIIKLLLETGATYYDTVLHFNSEKEEANVELLLDCIAKYGTQDQENEKILQFGVKNGREKLVKPLLEGGADVNALDGSHNTILSVAAGEGHGVIVELILRYRPDINNQSNRQAIRVAVHGKGEEASKIVNNLLSYGFTVDPEDVNDDRLLFDAAAGGCGRVVESLIKYGADVNTLTKFGAEDGYAPLHTATERNQEEVVEMLITSGADVNCKDGHGKTAIFYAAEIACLRSAKLLLTNSDVSIRDENGRSPLHFVALREHAWYARDCPDKDVDSARAEIAKLLLSKGACVSASDKDGVTVLHAACSEGYFEVVQVLLEYNADVNSIDSNRKTPLHLSAQQGNEAISKMLLDSGANVNAEKEDGLTSLEIAIVKGHNKIIKLLLESGADTKSNSHKIPPLHLIAEKGYCELIGTILKCGADVDDRDAWGRTALHIACKRAYVEIVQTLLEYGADINIASTAYSYTALDYAKRDIRDSPNRIYEWYDMPPYSRPKILKVLTCHLVKLKVAKFYVSEHNAGFISEYDGMDRFMDNCIEERKLMNDEKIGDSNISYDDVLAKGTNLLAKCMGNEGIMHVLKTEVYKTKFPIYAGLIESRVRKAITRKDLHEQAKNFFNLLITRIHHDCTEKILSYLNNSDIKCFIVACGSSGEERSPLFEIC